MPLETYGSDVLITEFGCKPNDPTFDNTPLLEYASDQAAGKYRLIIPSGEFWCASLVNLAHGTHIVGQNRERSILAATDASTTVHVWAGYNSTLENFTLRGGYYTDQEVLRVGGTNDGRPAERCYVRFMRIYAPIIKSGDGGWGIAFKQVVGGHIIGNEVWASSRDGINAQDSQDIVIANNTVYDSGDDGISSGFCSGIVVNGNRVIRTTNYQRRNDDRGACIRVEGTNQIVSDNVLEGGFREGIVVVGGQNQTITNNHIVETDKTELHTWGQGIVFRGEASAEEPEMDTVVIRGNIIESPRWHAIELIPHANTTQVQDIEITDNVITFRPVQSVTCVAATNVFTATAHGYVDGDEVMFTTLTGGAGITAGALYYVVSATANTFKVSATRGGTELDVTSDLTVGSVSPAYYANPTEAGAPPWPRGVQIEAPAIAVTNVRVEGNAFRNVPGEAVWIARAAGAAITRLDCNGNTSINGGRASNSRTPHYHITGVADLRFNRNKGVDTRSTKMRSYGLNVGGITGLFELLDNTLNNNQDGVVSIDTSGGLTMVPTHSKVRGNAGYSPWIGQAVTTAAAWSTATVGGDTISYKDLDITLPIEPIPNARAFVTPRFTGTGENAGGYEAGVKSLSGTTLSVRISTTTSTPVAGTQVTFDWFVDTTA